MRQGYLYSQGFTGRDIPLEKNCPYITTPKSSNETQVPLPYGCQSQGHVKVRDFETLDTLDEVLESLENNQPVIAGFKLSPNFYDSKGLIKFSDAHRGGRTDSHAAGHALLLIGFIKLPPSMHATEGQVCILTANSWGEGWGRGGYACLTEKWMLSFRIRNAFISLKSIDTL